MNKRLRTILQYSFFLGLGIFLVWWSIKDLSADDKSHIKSALKTARYWLLIPVFGLLLLSHFIRALRWRLLIEPLGYLPTKTNTFFAVLIGYLANQAVPRLGEVLKCTVLARYEKIPADKLIGTIILERIIDALTLLIVFAITLLIQPHLYTQLLDTFFSSPDNTEEKKKIAGWIIALIVFGVLLIALIVWMIKKKKNLTDLKLLIKKIINSIVQGVSAIKHLKKRKQFIFLSILIWTIYLMGGYIGFLALQETEHYGIKEAFTVLSAGSIGMIVTPGGIGAYAWLIQKTMLLYGLNEGIALAFGWILWLAQTAVILIGGLISFVALPYYNKRKNLAKR
ncbi:MAG: flippase-like domain-containing protein [Chitinophagaceae bacterium]|nr:flippase-like domain-containing protein [Chitinophagaceae bacterium]MBK8605489.1 flippase-like domain-containing protein [Chitinophagaceae bacterium]MBP7108527.1 flippase-like domain-containing protein [Chitinophagaceae bacterium]HQX95759.1 lysylphosphatidylglycerol synthase transmembrane domain-containing protein [Chitinophagaceae bacterium]HRA11660.1 lysylphosphatidylglycerol synthase transmembrane domain-containing protein [Chitinophagaceae bacterium]